MRELTGFVGSGFAGEFPARGNDFLGARHHVRDLETQARPRPLSFPATVDTDHRTRELDFGDHFRFAGHGGSQDVAIEIEGALDVGGPDDVLRALYVHGGNLSPSAAGDNGKGGARILTVGWEPSKQRFVNCGSIVCFSVLLATTLLAEEETGWSGSGDVGVTLATGNSESLRATAGLEVKGVVGAWELLGAASAIYGEDDGISSNERLDASLQFNRDLSQRVYAGLTNEFLYDPLAGVDWRFGVTPSLGWRVLKDSRFKMRVEAGPGYVWENRNGEQRGYSSVRLHENFSFQVTDDIRLFQSLTAEFEVGDFNNFLLSARAGIESKIIDEWSLRLAAKAIRYGDAHGADRDDLLVTIGFGYNYLPSDNGEGGLESAHEELEAEANDWVITALLGGSFAEGNSNARSINTGLEVKRVGERSEVAAGVFGSYGETDGVVSAQALAADAHYQFDLTKAWFVGIRSDFDHDTLANLEWRVALTPYLGHKLIVRKRSKLSVEAGPSGVVELQGASQKSYLGAYAALKGEHRIGKKTRLYGKVAVLSDSTDWASFLLTTEAGLDQSLSKRLTLKLIGRSTYDSTPAASRQRHDLQIVSALGVTF